jgi:uncharacterized membrane protein YccC
VNARVRALLRRFVRRDHTSGVWIAKLTVAAVASYLLADLLNTTPDPLLAPLTALLVVQLTMYETLAHGFDRIVSVVAGVLVAVVVATQLGLSWWSLALVIAVSLLLGRLLRLGPNLIEVPISAMLVFAVGGLEDAAAGRVVETLIGAAVGVLVTLLIVPPLYHQNAGTAIGEVAHRMAEFSRALGGALRREWSRAEASRWLDQARALGREVAYADERLVRAEEGARLNPRAKPTRQARPRLRTVLTALELSYVVLRNLTRAILDRTFFVPEDQQGSAYDQRTTEALADVLDAVGAALDALVPLANGGQPPEVARREVDARVDELTERRDRLAELLLVDPHEDAGAWEQNGALLAAVDRLRVEIGAAAHPSPAQWRPPVLTDRQREAMRKIVYPLVTPLRKSRTR